MALFVILGLMTVAAMALLVLPLVLRHGAIPSRAEYDMEIYRDQLDEIERDVERGVIDADERTSARTEIERRMLADVSVGATLSGCIYSSTFFALMARIDPARVRTFSIGY